MTAIELLIIICAVARVALIIMIDIYTIEMLDSKLARQGNGE